MSRIGKEPVKVPSGVTVSATGDLLQVRGPKGVVSRRIAPGVTFDIGPDVIRVHASGDSPQQRACHGLMRALLANMVLGVTNGFARQLEVDGVGYKAAVEGRKLVLHLGLSHAIEYALPADVSVEVDRNNVITVRGVDNEAVGQIAAEIRAFRPPDSYKGKGIRYLGERVRRKAGKAGQQGG